MRDQGAARAARVPSVGVLSSAVRVRRAARPNACSAARVRTIGSSAAGGRSPPTDISAAGRSAATSGPCSPIVTGKARRAHCDVARAPPGLVPASLRTAASTVRRSCSAPTPSPVDQPATKGRRTVVPARSPSTSTAPGRPVSRWTRSRAPPSPALPPLVETKVTVRFRRPPRTTSRELDHRRGARQLGARPAAERVAVGDHHEPGARLADLARDDRGQAALAVGRLGLEGRRADLVGAHGAEGRRPAWRPGRRRRCRPRGAPG